MASPPLANPDLVNVIVDFWVGTVIRNSSDKVGTAKTVVAVATALQLVAQGQVIQGATALEAVVDSKTTDPATIDLIHVALATAANKLQSIVSLAQGTAVGTLAENLASGACAQAISIAQAYIPAGS